MVFDIWADKVKDVLDKLGENEWYIVPEFQRGYRWTQQNITELFNDILFTEKRHNKKHFLGTYVIVEKSRESFKGDEKERSIIIDGQQRLATISIILAAIKDVTEANGWKIQHQLTTRLWGSIGEGKSCDRIQMGEHDKIIFQMIINKKDETDLEKIRQYFHLNNRLPKRELKLLALPELKKNRNKFNQRLYKAYQIILREIAQEMPDNDIDAENWLYKLSEWVLFRLTGCKVLTNDEATAYEVFESLNARGLGLTPSELLKNYLFSTAKKEKSLDNVRANWRTMENELPSDDVTPYLRHWYMSHIGYISTKNLYRGIRDLLESRKFNALKISKLLRDEAVIYSKLIEPSGQFTPEIRNALFGFKDMRIHIVYPVLLSVFGVVKSNKQRLMISQFLEKLCFRYIIICGGRGNVLEKEISVWATKIRSGKKKVDLIKLAMKELVKKDSGDSFFYQQFKIKSFHPGTGPARYLLSKIEIHMSGGYGPAASYTFDRENATVEHIFPRKPDPDAVQYMIQQGDEPEDEELKGRIGNLSLLCLVHNTESSNFSFPKKKNQYYPDADTLLTQAILNGFPGKPLYQAPQEWNTHEIETRQEWLVEYASQNNLWKLV